MFIVPFFTCTTAQPSLQHLQSYVVRKVGEQWKAFCLTLGVEEHVIGTANANNPGNINDAMVAALNSFLSDGPDPPFTWLRVISALELLGMTDYGKKLKNRICRGELDTMKRIE